VASFSRFSLPQVKSNDFGAENAETCSMHIRPYRVLIGFSIF
jgi:hypothetical protein